MSSVVQALAAVGVISFVPILYRLCAFIWLYFLRPSAVHQYLHGPPAYALITGASDGIGKAVAKELYNHGFNLILHGRNEAKLLKVVDEIQGSARARDVKYFVADASRADHDCERVLAPFKDLNITVVFHNVGSSPLTKEKINGLSKADLMSVIDRNAMFPLMITHTLLSQLHLSSRTGPVLVQFMGSQAGDMSPARLAVYAGSKAFLKALVRGLDTDERVWDTPTNVHFAYLNTAQVQSSTMHVPSTLVTPTSERYAKAVVARMGCGRRQYCPYWMHAVQAWSAQLLGESTTDKFAAQAVADLIAFQEKQN